MAKVTKQQALKASKTLADYSKQQASINAKKAGSAASRAAKKGLTAIKNFIKK